MNERLLDPTASMLTDLLGMGYAGEAADRSRFEMAGGNAGALIDVGSPLPGRRCSPT